VAPYLGRMDDAERNGLEEVLTMHRTLAAVHSATEVLVASVRNVETVVALAQQGVACFALQPEVAQQLFREPLTAAAVETFEADARQVAS
jgi:transaldolase